MFWSWRIVNVKWGLLEASLWWEEFPKSASSWFEEREIYEQAEWSIIYLSKVAQATSYALNVPSKRDTAAATDVNLVVIRQLPGSFFFKLAKFINPPNTSASTWGVFRRQDSPVHRIGLAFKVSCVCWMIFLLRENLGPTLTTYCRWSTAVAKCNSANR